MPDMDGKETARKIQQLVQGEATLVMISVADRTDVEREVAHLGITRFFSKPVFPSALYNTLVDLTDQTFVAERTRDLGIAHHWGDKTILLVEDIEINREIILGILAETGVAIECACDGVEAVEMWTAHGDRYDLIMMDMQMPRLDGLDATRQIRASGAHACTDVPIVAMTANAFKEDVIRCLQAGMNNHVAKPIDMDNLFDVLSRYLNQ